MTPKKILTAGLLLVMGSVSISEAQDLLPRDNGLATYHRSPRWRESESHPLRLVGYVLHPIGWVAREAIFRPLSYFTASSEFNRSFFGYREPFDYREPDCFNGSDMIPDCRTILPFARVNKDEAVEELPASVENEIVFPDINFEFDKANLNNLGRARVRQVAQVLSTVPSVKVIVEGHTDYKGSDEYNMKLGTRRAEAVIAELTDLGVDPARMSTISYGESRPLFTEEEDWARAANRRVNFTVNAGGEIVASNTATEATLPPATE